MNLGTELASNPKRLPEAIAAYEGALRIRADYPEAQRNLSLARGMLADSEAAERLNLGSTLAETPGRLADAIAHYEAALESDLTTFRRTTIWEPILLDVPGQQHAAIAHLERRCSSGRRARRLKLILGLRWPTHRVEEVMRSGTWKRLSHAGPTLATYESCWSACADRPTKSRAATQ